MDERQLAWMTIYASLIGLSRHPRAIADRERVPLRRFDECASDADDAMLEWDRRFNRPKIETP